MFRFPRLVNTLLVFIYEKVLDSKVPEDLEIRKYVNSLAISPDNLSRAVYHILNIHGMHGKAIQNER